jgi:hypothetical protein
MFIALLHQAHEGRALSEEYLVELQNAVLVPQLMDELMAFANTAPRHVDPVVAAAVASFGFVFIHPFMDGNGRLSRFVFHQALCRSGRLDKGLLLPVSVAMKRNEEEYLAVLQRYSRLARERWSVKWIDERFDVGGSDLGTLIMTCLDSGGVVSQRRPQAVRGTCAARAVRVSGSCCAPCIGWVREGCSLGSPKPRQCILCQLYGRCGPQGLGHRVASQN